MLPEADVLDANAAFYDACARGDVEAVESMWATRRPLVCIHPGWIPLEGREAVLASWRAILSGHEGLGLTFSDARACVLSRDAAFVTCLVSLRGDVRLTATNLFVREDRRWRLVLHQASPLIDAFEQDGDAEKELVN